MKILYIHHGQVLGGAPKSLLNTILGLKKISDCDIKVLCAHKEMKPFFKENAGVEVGDIYDPCLVLGRVLIGYSSIFNLATLKRLLSEIANLRKSIDTQSRQLKEEAPDIIHLNSSILFTTAIAIKKNNIPIVWHIREMFPGTRMNIRNILVGKFIRNTADKVIAIGISEAKNLGGGDKVEVINNSIDFSKFNNQLYNREEERRKYGIERNQKLIVFLGGVQPRKGGLELIEAMLHTSDFTKLIIAGSDKVESGNISYFEQVGLWIENLLFKAGACKYLKYKYNYRISKALSKLKSDKVVFIGLINDVVPLLSACDLLVIPFIFPHSARPLFEAWAMKKPVVAFDVKGVRENIDDGKDGLLVKKKTGKELARAINLLLENDNLIKKMGDEGYKKAYERFRQEANSKKILDIYEQILKNRSAVQI